MLKNFFKFLNRHIATWLFFFFSLEFYLGIDIKRSGLDTREEYIENAWLFFYIGIFFFIAVELWRYYNAKYNILPTDELDEIEKKFSGNQYCHYGVIIFGIIVLLRIFNVIQSDLLSAVLSVPFIIFIFYCSLKENKQ